MNTTFEQRPLGLTTSSLLIAATVAQDLTLVPSSWGACSK